MITIPTTFRFENGQFVPHDEELTFPRDDDEEEVYATTLERWGFPNGNGKQQSHGGGNNEIGVTITAAFDIRRPGQEFGYLVRIEVAQTYQHVLCRSLPDMLALLHYLTPMLQLGVSEWYQFHDMQKLWKEHQAANPPSTRR